MKQDKGARFHEEQIDFEKLVWLNTNEAAYYLRKSAHALRQMVYKGLLKPRKLGRRLFFRRIELDRLLESSIY